MSSIEIAHTHTHTHTHTYTRTNTYTRTHKYSEIRFPDVTQIFSTILENEKLQSLTCERLFMCTYTRAFSAVGRSIKLPPNNNRVEEKTGF